MDSANSCKCYHTKTRLSLMTSSVSNSSPVLDLSLCDFPQFVDLGRFACNRTRGHLSRSAEDVLGHERVSSRGSLDSDDTNSRIILRAIMCAVAQVSKPSLQSRVVVFLDERPIGDDVRLSGDGSPLARRIDEGDVDVRVARQVVSLPGLGVCVEEEVEAVGFL